MEQLDGSTHSPPSDRARRIRPGLVAMGVAAGIMLAGFGIAAAQESTPSTTSDGGTTPPPKFGGFGHRGFGFGGFGHGAIHGEFTTRAPNGGYQTLATQTGEVTSVSNSSITVKSEDGFDRTYAVNDNTLVNAGRDGIDDVKDGDEVRIMAVVDGDTARAVQVVDTTNLQRLGEQWRPRRPAA